MWGLIRGKTGASEAQGTFSRGIFIIYKACYVGVFIRAEIIAEGFFLVMFLVCFSFLGSFRFRSAFRVSGFTERCWVCQVFTILSVLGAAGLAVSGGSREAVPAFNPQSKSNPKPPSTPMCASRTPTKWAV